MNFPHFFSYNKEYSLYVEKTRRVSPYGISLVYRFSFIVQCVQQYEECKHSASGQFKSTVLTFFRLLYTLYNKTGSVD